MAYKKGDTYYQKFTKTELHILRILYYSRCTESNYNAIVIYFYWVDESTEDDQFEALSKCMDGGPTMASGQTDSSIGAIVAEGRSD